MTGIEIEKDAARYRWLKEALQVAYDGENLDYDGISVSCRMAFGRGEYRRVEAQINFGDKRGEAIDLDSAIDRVMPQGDSLPVRVGRDGGKRQARGFPSAPLTAGKRWRVRHTRSEKGRVSGRRLRAHPSV
ncbi:hypothetical protein Gbem_3001 [Citrifermentans bemidjiense Bem]|uniref:Uncharacterized protein n=1 Tax=Citrifermentans bemidjiense (strain ATCC BAA-1014 / DSM 16622 / JCM 12645 / Bem) TaxID=404380 RepID=B5E835_CITBB|nr:hypothetical protein [Citrifermentans bemidjiense]ACH40004.1 hypothetical protein Gbem_3001 [Citrifermentans bemidjiense Bem]